MENKSLIEREEYIQPDRSPAAMMLLAIEKNFDLDKVERAMHLQQEWETNEARKAYHEAMSRFKAEPPEIEKDRHVKFQTSKGTTEYRHASLANVTAKINAALSVHGLSAGWKVAQADKQITVTCTITHRLGHSESTSLSGSPDDSGSKNPIQAVGSTISYLSRYTLLCLTGLATYDQDDDSNGTTAEYITEEQTAVIKVMLSETGSDTAAFLQFIGADSIDKILAVHYAKAIAALKAKKGKKPTREPGQEG